MRNQDDGSAALVVPESINYSSFPQIITSLQSDTSTRPDERAGSSDSGDQKVVALTHSRKRSTKDVLKKSLILTGFNGLGIAGEFFRTYLLSGLGIETLGASVVIFSATRLIVNPVAMLAYQNAVFISNEYGNLKVSSDSPVLVTTNDQSIEHYHKEIGEILRQGWGLSIVSAVPPMVILLASSPILRLIGFSENISTIASSYFTPFAFAVPLEFILGVNEKFLSAVNKEVWLLPYKTVLIASGIGLNALLIPKWGATGAGLATLGQSAIGLIAIMGIIAMDKKLQLFEVFSKKISWKGKYMKGMLKQGWPFTVSQFLLAGANFGITISINNLGALRLAIEQSATQYMSIATTITHGVSEASNRLVGQAFGVKDYNLVRRYGNTSLFVSTCLYSLIVIPYNIFPLYLTSVFLKQNDANESGEDAEALIRYAFMMVSVARLFAVIQDNSALNLSAMHDTFLSSAINSFATIAIVMPLSLVSSYVLEWDIYGIGGAINLGLLFAASVTMSYWFRSSNRAVAENDFNENKNTSNAKVASLFQHFKKPKTQGYARVVEVKDEETAEKVSEERRDVKLDP